MVFLNLRASTFLCAVFGGSLLLVGFGGCFYGAPAKCEASSDCFDGEQCVAGTCQSAAVPDDTGDRDAQSADDSYGGGNEDDSGGGDDDTSSVDTSSPPDADTEPECLEYLKNEGLDAQVETIQTIIEKDDGICADYGEAEFEQSECKIPDDYQEEETLCGDTVDNDCNQAADCDDETCAGSDACGDRADLGAECTPDIGCRRGTCVKTSAEQSLCVHIVGLTVDFYPGGVAGGTSDPLRAIDSFCQEAGLQYAPNSNPSDWKAIISATDTESADRIPANRRISIEAPMYNPVRDRVAGGVRALGEGLDNPIEYTLAEESVGENAFVWTGTTSGGELRLDDSSDTPMTCDNWTKTTGDPPGGTGSPFATDGAWLEADSRDCSSEGYFYCINGQQ